MRRSHRAGAAVAATATLLTGAGFAFASLGGRSEPAGVTVVSETQPEDDLDATLRELRDEARDLQAEISEREEAARLAEDRERARKAQAAREQAEAATEDPAGAPVAQTRPAAPETDATTGASGSGEEEHEETEGDDDDGEGDDD